MHDLESIFLSSDITTVFKMKSKRKAEIHLQHNITDQKKHSLHVKQLPSITALCSVLCLLVGKNFAVENEKKELRDIFFT